MRRGFFFDSQCCSSAIRMHALHIQMGKPGLDTLAPRRFGRRRIACLTLLLCTATLTGCDDDPPPEPRVGQTAPDFDATDVKGATVSLSEFRGRSVVLLFSRAHW